MKKAAVEQRLFEMERAKRLELIVSVLQVCLGKDVYKIIVGQHVAGHTQAPARVFPTNEVEVWNDELEEIVAVWPKIRERVQHGVMTVVRSHCSGAIRGLSAHPRGCNSQ